MPKMIFGLIKDKAKTVINADVDSNPVNNIDKDNASHCNKDHENDLMLSMIIKNYHANGHDDV
jgi:hypothetical protein